MSPEFSTIKETVDAIARGEVVIVVDAEDRENEAITYVLRKRRLRNP